MTPTRYPKSRFAILLVAVILTLGGCSSERDVAPQTADRGGASSERADGKGASGSKPRGTATREGRSGSNGVRPDSESPQSADSQEGSDPRDGTPGSREPGDKGQETEIVRSALADPSDDTDSYGEEPAYGDLSGAAVEAHPQGLFLQARSAENYPAEMPDEGSNFTLSFSFKGPNGDFYVGAEADNTGWDGDIARNQKTFAFTGEVRVEGSAVTIVVPWEQIGGRAPFRWYLDSSWTRQTDLQTYFSFDRTPDFESVRFRP